VMSAFLSGLRNRCKGFFSLTFLEIVLTSNRIIGWIEERVFLIDPILSSY
jgi:hypothetical protein